MTERWSYPVAQAMQRHTGSRSVKPAAAPPMVPDCAPPQPPHTPSPSIAPEPAAAPKN